MRFTLVGLFVLFAAGVPAAAAEDTPFAIEVVDDRTGRGVPLVELRTTGNVRYYTDSNGLAAVDDPAFMGREVFFHVWSHGYEYPRDGFGNRGARIQVKPGGSTRLKIKRLNIAERLYRITGEGIYHDTVKLGRPAPIRQPLINALVTGQDSTQAAVYKGRVYWFWGDTTRLAYPLGHFGTAGATSRLPSDGGLAGDRGVDLEYFVNDEGFSRPTFDKEGNYPIWLDGLMVLKDKSGAERLVGKASVMKSLRETVARRLVVFNDDTKKFETLRDVPLDVPLHPQGHPLRVDVEGVPYVYCGNVFPNVRFKADWDSLLDTSGYEAFTCLAPGSRETSEPRLERDVHGKLVWGWKRDTAALGTRDLMKLLDPNKVAPDEAWPITRDVETKEPLVLALQSVQFNAFRRRYVGIGVQVGGKSSFLGEVWYSEADKPEGPWPWALKVVTHDRYSFYNPVQHPFLEGDGGRVLYFEGTYATTFSRPDRDATPRYDYNQVMYRLVLTDPRLVLPREPAPPPAGGPAAGF